MSETFVSAARAALEANAALTPQQAQAGAKFLKDGLPTRRLERWKYTDLKKIGQQEYDFSAAAGAVEIDEIPALLSRECTALLVLIDGELDALHSRREDLPLGLAVLTLQEAMERIPQRIAPYLAQSFDAPEDAMANLNSALLRGGFVIVLDDDLRVEPTIEVLHLSANRTHALALNTRGIVLAGAGKKARVVEHFGHVGGGNLINAVTQIVLAPEAQLQYLRLQDLCERGQLLARVQVAVANDAHLQMSTVELGGALSRLDTRVLLEGERARFDAFGLTAIKRRAHCDHQLEIVHDARDTTSTQTFRAVVDDRARSVFAGKVIVRPGADGADAKQSTRNLLLSANAEVDAKPELEIHADEVKCSHGATVGQLDERALFYLRTRGIDADTARSMLLRAFVEELLMTMGSDAVVAPLRARFESRFLT